jgi:hypothetical protein
LSGADGVERWRYVLGGGGTLFGDASHVLVTGEGDVIALGTVTESRDTGTRVRAVRFRGTDGQVVWTADLSASAVDVRGAAIDASGDLLVAGTIRAGDGLNNDFGAVKVSGATGSEKWTARLGSTVPTWEASVSVLPLASGEVLVGGFVATSTDDEQEAVVSRLDGTTGTEVSRTTDVGSDRLGVVARLVAAPDGRIIAAGLLRNRVTCFDVTVWDLADPAAPMRRRKLIDGRTTATSCRDSGWDGGGPDTTGGDIDRDDLYDLVLDAGGVPIVSGSLSDGPRGGRRGFVARLGGLRGR